MSTEKTKSVAPSMDTELARLVVDRQLATCEEIEKARLAQQASHRSFADVLVEQEAVTSSQLSRLKKLIQESRDRQLPGYKLVSVLGAGAMAKVYKAVQLSLDRPVAVKILPKRLSENSEYVKLFYKEGRAAAKLNHPNIVQAIDVGEAGGYHYFVMEFVEGHTLYDELANGKVFSEEEALKIIIQIATALKHAHSQGLIHRDVKPKNIMITPEGVVKLADMGLARSTGDAEAAQAEAGRAFGTPYYISPEQIRGEVDIDFRADIYSLGATLYHLVTGRVPFDGPTPVAVMHKHLKEPLVPPDHINTGLSSGIGEVVEVMMAKDRAKRYASTDDMLLDLQAIAAGEAPLQARRQIKDNVLNGLADAEQNGPPSADIADAIQQPPAVQSSLLTYIIALAAALAVSVLINIVMLLK
ncbi:MAG: serine/threonine protein kinase [Planctomycetes bacterium]|nr:serine/threonine protein kinase [Planctomycetota bacterium]